MLCILLRWKTLFEILETAVQVAVFVSSRFIDRAAEISSAAGVDGRVPAGLFIYINCAFGLFQSRRSLIEKGIRAPPLYYFKGRFSAKKGKHTHK